MKPEDNQQEHAEQRAPGWYPDPKDDFWQEYFDGKKLTGARRMRPAQWSTPTFGSSPKTDSTTTGPDRFRSTYTPSAPPGAATTEPITPAAPIKVTPTTDAAATPAAPAQSSAPEPVTSAKPTPPAVVEPEVAQAPTPETTAAPEKPTQPSEPTQPAASAKPSEPTQPAASTQHRWWSQAQLIFPEDFMQQRRHTPVTFSLWRAGSVGEGHRRLRAWGESGTATALGKMITTWRGFRICRHLLTCALLVAAVLLLFPPFQFTGGGAIAVGLVSVGVFVGYALSLTWLLTWLSFLAGHRKTGSARWLAAAIPVVGWGLAAREVHATLVHQFRSADDDRLAQLIDDQRSAVRATLWLWVCSAAVLCGCALMWGSGHENLIARAAIILTGSGALWLSSVVFEMTMRLIMNGHILRFGQLPNPTPSDDPEYCTKWAAMCTTYPAVEYAATPRTYQAA